MSASGESTQTEQRVLVTGGSRGIGLAVCRLFHEKGYRVTAVGRSASPRFLDPEIEYLQADLCNLDDARWLCDYIQNQPPAILINNLGVERNKPFEELSLEDFQHVLNGNLLAHFLLCKAAIPSMRQNQWGRIVFVTSIWGNIAAGRRQAYAASKFALQGFAMSLADEYGAEGVLVNCVAPGFIDIDATGSPGRGPERNAYLSERIPLKRLGRPAEVAQHIQWLASPECSYVSGQVLAVDGGFLNSGSRGERI